MNKVLIDTDVILDFITDRQPFSKDSAKVMSLCESNQIKGFVTPLILSNLYYILRKTVKHEKVIETLRILLSFIDVITISKKTVLQALNSPFNDFEDALQNYSAESDGKIDVIITRNIKDYKNSTLSIQTPENYLKTRTTMHQS